MSFQRRRGQAMTLYPAIVVTDRRGDQVETVDMDNPIETIGWVIPQRSSRAEVPGQQEINVVRIGVASDLGNVTLFSQVDWNGQSWDVVTPPEYHHGVSRHTRHWTLDLRQRP